MSDLGGDAFPAPAPSGPFGAPLAAFNGMSADGVWRLFVFDDSLFAGGSTDQGWSSEVNRVSAQVGEPVPVLYLEAGLLITGIWLRRRARKRPNP